MFLGLLVKAMKNDINLKRVSAFAKRLLQVNAKSLLSSIHSFSFSIFVLSSSVPFIKILEWHARGSYFICSIYWYA